ncbi:MAG: hypothetical protein ABW136_10875 [Steroidobacteraceae bacterium]
MSEALEALAKLLHAESGDGRALVNSPEDNPVCSISLDHEIRCVEIVWKRYATSVQLRYAHEWLLMLLQKNQFSRVLGDDSALPTIHADDQAWIATDWLPRASAAGLKRAANKQPASQFAQLAIQQLRALSSGSVAFGSFADLDSARNWLRTF